MRPPEEALREGRKFARLHGYSAGLDADSFAAGYVAGVKTIGGPSPAQPNRPYANVSYGSAVGDWYRFAKNVGQRTYGRPVMGLFGQPSMAAACNSFLNACVGKGFAAAVWLHDDLEVTDPDFEAKVLAALADDVALVGVAGGGPSLRWWDHSPVGHQMTDSGLVDFGARTGDVDMIEGSVMVFSPWAVENLRVDERYTDFRSGWDDVCLHARQAGKRVVVADVDTHHHSTIGWKSPEIEAKFAESERIFAEKWGTR